MTRYVNPWTTPDQFSIGDRAHNPGSLDREMTADGIASVCPRCDRAMTKRNDDDERCCPGCGITEREAMRRLARHLRAVS